MSAHEVGGVLLRAEPCPACGQATTKALARWSGFNDDELESLRKALSFANHYGAEEAALERELMAELGRRSAAAHRDRNRG